MVSIRRGFGASERVEGVRVTKQPQSPILGRGLPLPYPALDYPSISKILGLPNVWSSDLPVRSMFLNSQTLGRSWDPLGRSRDALGALLGTLGELLGRSWAPFGRSWGTLGRSWDALGALLGASWTTLGRNLEKCRGGWRS